MVFVNAAKLGFMNGRKLLMPMTFARRKVDVRGEEDFRAKALFSARQHPRRVGHPKRQKTMPR